jgi:phage-related protein
VWNTIKSVWNWIKGNWPLLLAIITGPIGLAVRWVVKHWDQIITKVKTIPGRIKSAFSSAGSWLVNAGRNVVRGLWNGIKGMGGWLRDTLIGWARSSIPGPIAKALGIASPSKVAAWLGEMFGKGIPIGLDRTQDSVRRAAGRLAAAAVATPPGGSGSAAGGASGAAGVTLRVELPDTELGRLLAKVLREFVRVQGRGDVQVALGTRVT